MFKNATILKIKLPQPFWLPGINTALEAAQFTPCESTQQKSIGWVPPRGVEHGALVEHIDGQLILAMKIETKSVPGATIKKRVAEMAAEHERSNGRKPGKKQTKELKEQALLELLPAAFPKTKVVQVWIDPTTGIMLIDSASAATVDDITMAMVKHVDGTEVSYINTECSPATIMGTWLLDGQADWGFELGRTCELKATDETKAVVRYTNHSLDTAEIRDHITKGKYARKLGLAWRGRVSFVLDASATLSKVEFLDIVFESAEKRKDVLEANVAIATGELRQLIPDLIEALGGETTAEAAAA